MGQTTNIEWTATVNPDGSVTKGSTWNPTRGCSRVSEGCRHCYAESLAARFSGTIGGRVYNPKSPFALFAEMTKSGPRWTGKVELVESALDLPIRWKKPRRIFVNSMSDLFHESLSHEAIDRVWAVMLLTELHTYQILTKRPQVMRDYLVSAPILLRRRIASLLRTDPMFSRHKRARAVAEGIEQGWRGIVPKWIWLGTSVEDEATAQKRIPILLDIWGVTKFVSYEPALGPVDFTEYLGCSHNREYEDIVCPVCGFVNTYHEHLDWIIVGGESGPGARPFDIAWARKTINQCATAGTACFVKQLGAHPYDQGTLPSEKLLKDRKGGDMQEWPVSLRVREYPQLT